MRIGLARGFLYASLAVAAGVILIAGVLFASRILGQASVSVPSNPVLVIINQPPDWTKLPKGSSFSIQAEAIGAEPIQAMQLWVDGKLIEEQIFEDGGYSVVSSAWSWTVPDAGDHVLIVRAIDDLGRQGQSNPVRVIGTENSGARLVHPSAEGEDLASLATAYEVPLEELINANQGVDPSASLSEGEEVFVPFSDSFPSPPLQEPTLGQVNTPLADPPPVLNPLTDGLERLFSRSEPAQLPSPPSISVHSEGCTAVLSVEDTASNETGFLVYRLSPGSSAFSIQTTYGPNSDASAFKHADTPPPGKVIYYVSAFNSAGQAASNLVAFDRSLADCPRNQFGELRIDGGYLLLPRAVESAYYYSSAGGGPWMRHPADEHAFFNGYYGALPLGGRGDSTQKTYVVWGWSGGALEYLGIVQSNQNLVPSADDPGFVFASRPQLQGCQTGSCYGDIGQLGWSDTVVLSAWEEVDFRWYSDLLGTEGGLWQISSAPLPVSCTFSPPGLLDSGFAPGKQDDWREFTVNLSNLAPAAIPFSQQDSSVAAEPQLPPLPPDPLQAGLPTMSKEVLEFPENAPQASLSSSSASKKLPPSALFGPGIKLYVRIIPIVNDQPICPSSNMVVITIDTTPQPQVELEVPDLSRFDEPLYKITILEYSHPVFPDPNRWGCVKVTGYINEVWEDLYQATKWKLNTEVCPEPWDGSDGSGFFGDLFSILEEAINKISELYSKLDALVKDLVAKFNPLCLQAKFAAEAIDSGVVNKENVENACKIGASIAVDALKTSFGLPPTLPDYEQLKSLGKDYVVELAADELTSKTGVPCPDECKALLEDSLDSALNAIANTSFAPACVDEKIAHQNGVWPLCPPEGVIVKPATSAEYTPPAVKFQVRRLTTPSPEPFPTCTLLINHMNSYQFPGGTVQGPYSPTGSPSKEFPPQEFGSPLFDSIVIDMPQLTPGEITEFAAIFDKALPIVFPWTKEMYQPYSSTPDLFGTDFYTMVKSSSTDLRATSSFDEFLALKNSPYSALLPESLPCAAETNFIVPPMVSPTD